MVVQPNPAAIQREADAAAAAAEAAVAAQAQPVVQPAAVTPATTALEAAVQTAVVAAQPAAATPSPSLPAVRAAATPSPSPAAVRAAAAPSPLEAVIVLLQQFAANTLSLFASGDIGLDNRSAAVLRNLLTISTNPNALRALLDLVQQPDLYYVAVDLGADLPLPLVVALDDLLGGGTGLPDAYGLAATTVQAELPILLGNVAKLSIQGGNPTVVAQTVSAMVAQGVRLAPLLIAVATGGGALALSSLLQVFQFLVNPAASAAAVRPASIPPLQQALSGLVQFSGQPLGNMASVARLARNPDIAGSLATIAQSPDSLVALVAQAKEELTARAGGGGIFQQLLSQLMGALRGSAGSQGGG